MNVWIGEMWGHGMWGGAGLPALSEHHSPCTPASSLAWRLSEPPYLRDFYGHHQVGTIDH